MLIYIIVGVVVVAAYLYFTRDSGEDDSLYGGDSLGITASDSGLRAPGSGGDGELEDASAYEGGELFIYFGSQTGSAETFSKTLAKEGRRHKFAAHAVDLEDVQLDELLATPRRAIFVMATYGDGDPTDNAVEFASALADASDGAAASLEFTVFGLGNRQYELYNAMGKLVNRRLEELGGTRIYDYGEGDDDGTLEEDFEAWKENLWQSLVSRYLGEDIAADDGAGEPQQPELALRLEELLAEEAEMLSARRGSDVAPRVDLSSRAYFQYKELPLTAARQLRGDGGAAGSTLHVELDAAAAGMTYDTAANLGLLADNSSEAVQSLAAACGFDLDAWFTFHAAKGEDELRPPFPLPCDVRTALTRYCDVNGMPSRALIGELAFYATDAEQRAAMVHLASRDGKEAYAARVTARGLTLVELLAEEFPSCRPPLSDFLQLAPRLLPRYYTIASSAAVHPGSIHLAVKVVKEDKTDGRVHWGTATGYLARLAERMAAAGEGAPPPRVRVVLRDSGFFVPAPERPMICVGPGTGFAPMRALLQERELQLAGGADGGHTSVYFGCQKRDVDFIYEDEIMHWSRSALLSNLRLAFSREQAEKVYVQHHIAEDQAALWKAMQEQDGVIFVCGGTAMGHDVQAAFEAMAVELGGLDAAAAHSLVRSWQTGNRYVQELWSA
eukprot:PLAT5748.1.p2 GENE.PLAT5748.1~~PLAT5748.1.p2  ORF type:complete len:671 (-),score=387.82 PLAT5748.1:209-2221(-)